MIILPYRVDVRTYIAPTVNLALVAVNIAVFAAQWVALSRLPPPPVAEPEMPPELQRALDEIQRDVAATREAAGMPRDDRVPSSEDDGADHPDPTDGAGGSVEPSNAASDNGQEPPKLPDLWFTPFILDGWNPVGLLGHMFLHGDLFHLLGNMLFLWLFGNAVASRLDRGLYLALYIGLGLVAATSHNLFLGGKAMGASGAVSGVVALYVLLFPRNQISMFYYITIFRWGRGTFNVPGWVPLSIYFALDVWGAFKGTGGIAYAAHVGGFLGGLAVGLWLLKTGKIWQAEEDETLLDILSGAKKPEPNVLDGWATTAADVANPLAPLDPNAPAPPKRPLFAGPEARQVLPVVGSLPVLPRAGAGPQGSGGGGDGPLGGADPVRASRSGVIPVASRAAPPSARPSGKVPQALPTARPSGNVPLAPPLRQPQSSSRIGLAAFPGREMGSPARRAAEAGGIPRTVTGPMRLAGGMVPSGVGLAGEPEATSTAPEGAPMEAGRWGMAEDPGALDFSGRREKAEAEEERGLLDYGLLDVIPPSALDPKPRGGDGKSKDAAGDNVDNERAGAGGGAKSGPTPLGAKPNEVPTSSSKLTSADSPRASGKAAIFRLPSELADPGASQPVAAPKAAVFAHPLAPGGLATDRRSGKAVPVAAGAPPGTGMRESASGALPAGLMERQSGKAVPVAAGAVPEAKVAGHSQAVPPKGEAVPTVARDELFPPPRRSAVGMRPVLTTSSGVGPPPGRDSAKMAVAGSYALSGGEAGPRERPSGALPSIVGGGKSGKIPQSVGASAPKSVPVPGQGTGSDTLGRAPSAADSGARPAMSPPMAGGGAVTQGKTTLGGRPAPVFAPLTESLSPDTPPTPLKIPAAPTRAAPDRTAPDRPPIPLAPLGAGGVEATWFQGVPLASAECAGEGAGSAEPARVSSSPSSPRAAASAGGMILPQGGTNAPPPGEMAPSSSGDFPRPPRRTSVVGLTAAQIAAGAASGSGATSGASSGARVVPGMGAIGGEGTIGSGGGSAVPLAEKIPLGRPAGMVPSLAVSDRVTAQPPPRLTGSLMEAGSSSGGRATPGERGPAFVVDADRVASGGGSEREETKPPVIVEAIPLESHRAEGFPARPAFRGAGGTAPPPPARRSPGSLAGGPPPRKGS